MNKIEAIIQPHKLEEVKEALKAAGVDGMTVIDARGHVVKSLPWRTAGVIDAMLPAAAKAPPPFARFGNLIPILLGFALMLGGIVLGRGRR